MLMTGRRDDAGGCSVLSTQGGCPGPEVVRALSHTVALLVPGTGGLCSPRLSLDPVLK